MRSASDLSVMTLERELRAAVLAARNGDGGWGYAARRRSRLEPTAAALLALGDAAAAQRVLGAWPARDGLLLDPVSNSVNYAANGLAALTLLAAGARMERLASSLIEARPPQLKSPDPRVNRVDASLRGWAWVDNTFSWVEPTAWCLLALKRWRDRGATTAGLSDRIAEAEKMLVDRACASGGWNFGNARVFGQDLSAYIPTTALALLALHDRGTKNVVAKGLAYLEAQALTEQSGMPLALTAICLGLFGGRTAAVVGALGKAWQRTRLLDNTYVMSLALYAVSGAGNQYEAFRV